MSMFGKLKRSLGLYNHVARAASTDERPYVADGEIIGGFEAGQRSDRVGSSFDYGTPPEVYLYRAVDNIRSAVLDAERNDPIVNSIINKLVRGTVGAKGFIPHCSDDSVLDLIERQSRRENFSADAKTSRAEFIRLAIRYIIRDGEVLVKRHRKFDNAGGFALQIIDPGYLFTSLVGDAHVFGSNRVRLGIEENQYGKTVGYHFKGDPRSHLSSHTYYSGRTYREPADDYLHLFPPLYTGQPRGVSSFAPVLHLILLSMKYRKTAMTAAEVAAFAAIIAKTMTGAPAVGQPIRQARHGRGVCIRHPEGKGFHSANREARHATGHARKDP